MLLLKKYEEWTFSMDLVPHNIPHVLFGPTLSRMQLSAYYTDRIAFSFTIPAHKLHSACLQE